MANEPYITKKDLEDVTQRVAIVNAKELAKPIADENKKVALKNLETSIEQKALFQDIADGIKGLGESLLKGLKSLIPKTDGGLSKLLGLGLGLLLAPFVVFIAFITQLGVELKFFGRLVGRGLSFIFKPIVSWFKKTKLGKKIIGVFQRIFIRIGKIFKPITNIFTGKNKHIQKVVTQFKNMFRPITTFFAKNKTIQKVVTLFKRVFTGKGGFFGKIGNFFKAIKTFATGGPFGTIMKFAKGFGRILGKIFLPLTILISIFDFVKGFMKGYEEDGIIGGIKEGFNGLFEGLIGGLLRILMWIPTKLAEWLGLDRMAAEIGKSTEKIIQGIKDLFGGLVDLVVGIFTWDTEMMSGALGKIWDSIWNIMIGAFAPLIAGIKDIFGGSVFERIKLTLKSIGLKIASFFLYLQEGIVNIMSKIPRWMLGDAAKDFIDDAVDGHRETKRSVDAEIESIEILKNRLKLQDGLEKKDNTSNASSGGGVNSTSNNSTSNVNNVTYNVVGSSNIATDALNFVTGRFTSR